MVVLIIPLLST